VVYSVNFVKNNIYDFQVNIYIYIQTYIKLKNCYRFYYIHLILLKNPTDYRVINNN